MIHMLTDFDIFGKGYFTINDSSEDYFTRLVKVLIDLNHFVAEWKLTSQHFVGHDAQ